MKTKSFTLIELLVVIVIIGILAGVITITTTSYISKANFAKAQAFSSTVQTELLSDLVSEWTFDSPAVANITEDSWGNNDGTLMGTNGLPQLQSKENCVYGTCYLFDGADDYIEIENKIQDVMFFTVSGWIKLNNNQTSKTIFSNQASGGWVVGISDSVANKLKFYLGSTTIYSTTIFTNNVWHYFTITYNNGSPKIYINGELETAASDIISQSGSYYPNTIGCLRRSTTSQFFKGLIDDVRFYNAVLSSAQIKQEYVAGLNSLYSKGLISKEDFEEKISTLK